MLIAVSFDSSACDDKGQKAMIAKERLRLSINLMTSSRFALSLSSYELFGDNEMQDDSERFHSESSSQRASVRPACSCWFGFVPVRRLQLLRVEPVTRIGAGL
jgi:hypothetical protein